MMRIEQLDWVAAPPLEESRARRRAGTRGLKTDTPRSRAADPDTSHAAAEKVRRSGELKRHQDLIAATVRARPGLTYTEIAEACGLERHAVARRLKELEPAHIQRGPPTARGGGKSRLTWYPPGETPREVSE